MICERFSELVIIIFFKTFGIKKTNNARNGGVSVKDFPSYQLNRDLKCIKNGERLLAEVIYLNAIEDFFNLPLEECIDKTVDLFEQLVVGHYIEGANEKDILSKCDDNTLPLFKELLIMVWNYYFGVYELLRACEESYLIECFSVPEEIENQICCMYVEHCLPLKAEDYEEIKGFIVKNMLQQNPDTVYQGEVKGNYIKTAFEDFSRVIKENSFHYLSSEEKRTFLHTLYAISDVLDQNYDENSYSVNVELLSLMDTLYSDNFQKIQLEDINIVQGCVYAIAINESQDSLKGNIELTKCGNIIRKRECIQGITRTQKYEMCLAAMETILNNYKLQNYAQKIANMEIIVDEESLPFPVVNKLRNGRPVMEKDYVLLTTLTKIYSNIAAIHLQYVKHKIGTEVEQRVHMESCIWYQNVACHIRYLIIRVVQRLYPRDDAGNYSDKYKEAVFSLASFYNTLATRFYYQKDYAATIVIRSVLYQFYILNGCDDKAAKQLDYSPFQVYENEGRNPEFYNKRKKQIFEEHRKKFRRLAVNVNSMLDYEEIKEKTL